MLLNAQRPYISGEEISHALSVSRAAVWKHVQGLKGEGYAIESVRNKGYRLTAWPDCWEAAAAAGCFEGTLFGRWMEIHDTIDSTSLRARVLAGEGAPEGTLVAAEMQTGGRGRMGRTWSSPKGQGLWFSLVLRPKRLPEEAYQVVVPAALAVAAGILQTTGLKAGIKWPNDILLKGRKVCGLLAEFQGQRDWTDFIILGIGVNVHQKEADFPEDLHDTAVSLAASTRQAFRRMDLAAAILEAFEERFQVLQQQGLTGLLEEYRAHSVTVGHPVQVLDGQRRFDAYALDIAEDGGLVVRLEDGQERVLHAGEVSIRG